MDSENIATIFYFFLTLTVMFHLAVVIYWSTMNSRYEEFAKDTRAVQNILRDILQQSINRGSVDIRTACARHSLSIETFRETLFNHFEWHAIEEVGELDLDAGKFYSYVWEESSQLGEGDFEEINAEFETYRQVEFDHICAETPG